MLEKDTRNPWATQASAVKYDNRWIRVTENQVLNPSGNPGIYGVVHYKNLAIGVLPLDEQLNTWLVGQYRYPLNEYSWEIPEGGGAIGVPPLESAQRELKEETGLVATQWRELLRMHLSNSVSDELAILYLARGLRQEAAEPEDTEDLRLIKVPIAQAYQYVLSSQITDAMSVAGILRVQLMLEKGEL
jgi:8-oxo-dGTP pyrophosphatase MutT (NUDIX family)